jgi:hypothetical protein
MISAKEKAVQLVKKYFNLFSVQLENTISKSEAKQCAIICVDEILDSYPHTFDLSEYTTKEGLIHISIENVRSNMGYWQQVKTEIENYD